MRRPDRGGIFFRLFFLLLLLALLGVVYLMRHPLLRAAGDSLVVDEPPQPSDAILLLSDDNFSADRATRAAELYHGRWAPRIVASGRRLRAYASIAELMQRDLTDRGVPADAVIRFPHSADNTREESESLRALVVDRGWHRVLVVTSNCHTRRARYVYRRIFPATVEVRVISVRDSDYDPRHWWESRRGIKLFVLETAGLAVAVWELWHAQASRAGSPARSAVSLQP